MAPDRPADVRPAIYLYLLLVPFVLMGTTACNGAGAGARVPGDGTKTIAAPLTAGADTSDSGRAAYYTAEATRYRDIANHARQLSAAYARWTPPATATKNWNAILKTRADARAAAADQIAAGIQVEADFHTAAAAKAGAQ